MRLLAAVLVVCSVQSLQLESQASRRPRVTKYSKTTTAPGDASFQEPATEDLLTASYHLQREGGETCILFNVDALIDISYVTTMNERVDANIFVPINANVAGICKESDVEHLVISFKEFKLEFTFAKNPSGERWYSGNIKLSYNSSARILEHAAKQGRRIVLTTKSRSLLFATPVGKSFFCPEETIVDLVEDEASPNVGHRAKLYLRQMRLQAFMFKRDGEFGPPWHCLDSGRVRSETAPVAVGALAIATAGTLVCLAIWKVQYDTVE